MRNQSVPRPTDVIEIQERLEIAGEQVEGRHVAELVRLAERAGGKARERF